jgi:hypothetical protein
MFLTLTFRDAASPACKVDGAGFTIVIAALYALSGRGLGLTALVKGPGDRSSVGVQAAKAIAVTKQMMKTPRRFIRETLSRNGLSEGG